MHCANASIFYPTFLSLPFLSDENKTRVLNFKVWVDFAMYASRRSPALLLEEISGYVPARLPAETSTTNGYGSMKDTEWPGIFKRLFELDHDDGHAIKLGRAVRNGEVVSEGYEGEEWCMLKGYLWEKVGNMVVDSVEDSGVRWARSVGFDEAVSSLFFTFRLSSFRLGWQLTFMCSGRIMRIVRDELSFEILI
jgi:hypothetical protein